MQAIERLGEGEYTLEFVREQARVVSSGTGPTAAIASERAAFMMKLSRCILRVVETREEVEDRSRASLSMRDGKIKAVVDRWNRAKLTPVPA